MIAFKTDADSSVDTFKTYGIDMSDVEKFWEAIRRKWPTPQPSFHQLDPMEQMMLVQAINIILQILNNHER